MSLILHTGMIYQTLVGLLSELLHGMVFWLM